MSVVYPAGNPATKETKLQPPVILTPMQSEFPNT